MFTLFFLLLELAAVYFVQHLIAKKALKKSGANIEKYDVKIATGETITKFVLNEHKIENVKVIRSTMFNSLFDYHSNVITLGKDVFNRSTFLALMIALHETMHAVQGVKSRWMFYLLDTLKMIRWAVRVLALVLFVVSLFIHHFGLFKDALVLELMLGLCFSIFLFFVETDAWKKVKVFLTKNNLMVNKSMSDELSSYMNLALSTYLISIMISSLWVFIGLSVVDLIL